MSNFIREVINNPREYWPFLVMLGALLLVWAGLCLSGLISICARGRRLKFWFAIPPLVFGLIGVDAKIPIEIQENGSRLSFDFGWLFLVPLLAGVAGLVLWWKARAAQNAARAEQQRQGAQATSSSGSGSEAPAEHQDIDTAAKPVHEQVEHQGS